MSFKNKLKRKFEEDVMSEISWKLLLKNSNPATEEQKRTILSERAEERRSMKGNSIQLIQLKTLFEIAFLIKVPDGLK